MHFLFEEQVCPRAGAIIEQRKKFEIIKDFNKKFNDTFGEKLMTMMNIKDKDFFCDYDNIHEIADTFVADYTDGRELKKLKDFGIDIEELYKLSLESLKIDVLEVYSGDSDLAIVSMNALFKEIDQWMVRRIVEDQFDVNYLAYISPKLVIYSSHDRQLAHLQTYLSAVFNLTELNFPDYASSFMFELYRPDNIQNPNYLDFKDYYLTISFNDKLLFNMTYNDFSWNVKEKLYRPHDISKFCGWPDPSPTPPPTPQKEGFNYFFLTTIILGFISLAELMFILCDKKRHPNNLLDPNSYYSSSNI